jgi:hypothetical protein
MSTLFQLSEEMQRIADVLRREDGDLGEGGPEAPDGYETLEAWFDGIHEQIHDKVDDYCFLIAEIEAYAKVRREKAAQLARLSLQDESTVARLKDRLRRFMVTNDMTKIETANHKIRVQNNGGAQSVSCPGDWEEHPELAPDRFQHKAVYLDKNAISRAVRDGEKIPGCILLPRGNHISIK